MSFFTDIVSLSAHFQGPPDKPPRVSAQVIALLTRLGTGSLKSAVLEVIDVFWKFPDGQMAAGFTETES